MDAELPRRVNGHAPDLGPDEDDVELDELDQVVLHLRRIGRPLRLDRGRYHDPVCPICKRSEVLIANVETREVVLRCRDPLCDRGELLTRYGIGNRAVEAQTREAAIGRRLEELIIDHHARARFATWLAAQPQERL